MQLFLKKNKVFLSNIFTPNFDKAANDNTLEAESIDLEKKDVYLGPNGAGKSFLWQSFTYLACLYKKIPIQNQYAIIQRLAEAGIGDVDEVENKFSIYVNSSYSPHSINKLKKSNINYNLKFYANLGKNAQKIFNNYGITYYSNSPYPSCISFFNKDCSSLSSKDIDYEFWSIYKNNEFKKNNLFNTSIKLWVNFSVYSPKLSSFLNKEYIRNKKDDLISNHKNCFAYVKEKEIKESFQKLEDNYQNSLIYKAFDQFEINDIKFPEKNINTDELSLEDFILLLLIHEKNKNYNYILQIDNKDLDTINSGTKCNYIFKCLSLLNQDNKNQILIIDEPENSLHMTAQEKITDIIPENFKLILITHSPAFVLNLLDNGFNNHNLYIMIKEKNTASIEKRILNYASLDDIAAEYFGYSPIISSWEEKNPITNFKDENFISVNDFYEKIKAL